jgi:hypothetical protein
MAEYSKLANAVPFSREEPFKWHGFIAHGSVGDMNIEEVYLFPFEGMHPDRLLVGETRMIQCPLCGVLGFSTLFPPESNGAAGKHDLAPHTCAALDALAQHYDVESHFLDFTPDFRPKGQPTPPIVSLASEWAQNARFEDGNFYEALEDKLRVIQRLRELGAFSSSQFISDLHIFLLTCKKDHRNAYYEPSRADMPDFRLFSVFFDDELP